MDDHPRRCEEKKYQTILFDMDGVITSERQYWTTAALTVFELFYDDEELNIVWCEENATAVSHRIFNNDATIKVLKELGINTNWDLAYLTLLAAYIKKAEGEPEETIWEAVTDFFCDCDLMIPELYDFVAEEVCDLYHFSLEETRRSGQLWKNVKDVFQQWYLGDELYQKIYQTDIYRGKKGCIHDEQPLFSLEQTEALLRGLQAKGYRLGIGTGRPDIEIREPLKMWGILDLFDEEAFVTYDMVESAQKKCPQAQLAKPHPYVFVKGALGKNFSDEQIVKGAYQLEKNVLVVGDAGSDILAAREAGMDFAAVLTGIAGKDAYDYFKALGAQYILDDIFELEKIL